MPDPLDELGRQLASLQRQINILATAARAPYTSLSGGYIRALPTSGGEDPKIYFGSWDAGDVAIVLDVEAESGQPGEVYLGTVDGAPILNIERAVLQVLNADATDAVLAVNSDGTMVRPLIATAWQMDTNSPVDSGGRPTTTSASYVTLWRTLLPVTTGEVYVNVDVYPGVGNTVDAKVIVRDLGTLTAHDIVGASATGVTTTTVISGTYDVPTSFSGGNSPVGHLGQFEVQLRRTAGASAVTVAPYLPISNI